MTDSVEGTGATSPSSSDSLRTAAYVFLAGALGGVTWWVWQRAIGVQPFNWGWYQAIPALLLLGGVASLAGVFMLANSDTSPSRFTLIRTLVYALLCGVFWRPVLEAGGNLVNDTVTAAEAPDIQKKQAELAAAIGTGDVEKIDAKLDEVTRANVRILGLASKVSNPALRARFIENSTEAIATIQQAAQKAPDKSIESLEKVGVAAAQNDQADVTDVTVRRLTTLQAREPAKTTQAVKSIQREALRRHAPVAPTPE